MFGLNLIKHWREVSKFLRNNQYEMTDDGGILIARTGATLRGCYTHWVTGKESEIAHDHNFIPDEGLVQFLGEVLQEPALPAHVTAWYMALHSGTGVPDEVLNADNYDSTLSEITSGLEGYSEPARILWVPDTTDVANTETINDAVPASFTIATATNLIVNGAAILSSSVKGSQSGVLISANKFTATRTLADGDIFNMKYKIDFDAV
jgi:hypothetical protein